MENKFIKFYVDDNNELKFEVIECDKYVIGYQALREAIGGYIDSVRYVDFGKSDLFAYVDDESIIREEKPTFWILDDHGIYEYPLAGNVVVVKQKNLTGEGMESVCLSEEEIELVCSKVLTDGEKHYFLCMKQINLDGIQKLYGRLEKWK